MEFCFLCLDFFTLSIRVRKIFMNSMNLSGVFLRIQSKRACNRVSKASEISAWSCALNVMESRDPEPVKRLVFDVSRVLFFQHSL
jgi:hypothetical protein